MFTRYHEPLGNNPQDPLPTNWQELEKQACDMPRNFGVVKEQVLYRSGIVYPKQIKTLRVLYWIRHIISLIHGDWLKVHYDNTGVTIHQFPILERKALTRERVLDIIWVIQGLDWPALVHCLKWTTRTWMVCCGYKINSLGQYPIVAILDSSLRHWLLNPSAVKEIMKYWN